MPSSDTSDPATRPRVVTERRQRPLRWGIALVGVGVGAVVVGAALLTGSQALQAVDASARAEIPTPLEFDADGDEYAILLLPETIALGPIPDPVTRLECEVGRADGTSEVIVGRRQGVRLETSIGETVGTFTAPDGPTTVRCDFIGSPQTSGYFVAVAPARRSLAYGALSLACLGVLAMAAGASSMVVGFRGRAVMTTG